MHTRTFRPIPFRESRYIELLRTISEETEPHRRKLRNVGLLCLLIGCFLILAIPVASSAKAHIAIPVLLACLATILLLSAMVLIALSKASKQWKNKFYHEFETGRSSCSKFVSNNNKGKIASPTHLGNDVIPSAEYVNEGANIVTHPYHETKPILDVTSGCTDLSADSNPTEGSAVQPQFHSTINVQIYEEEDNVESNTVGHKHSAKTNIIERRNIDNDPKYNMKSLRKTRSANIQQSYDGSSADNHDRTVSYPRKFSFGNGSDRRGDDLPFVRKASEPPMAPLAVQARYEENDPDYFRDQRRDSASSSLSSQPSNSSRTSRSRSRKIVKSSGTMMRSRESLEDPIEALFHSQCSPRSANPSGFIPLETLFSVDERNDIRSSSETHHFRNQHPIDLLLNFENIEINNTPQSSSQDSQFDNYAKRKWHRQRQYDDGYSVNRGHDKTLRSDHEQNADYTADTSYTCNIDRPKSAGDEYELYFEAANRISPRSTVRRTASTYHRQRRDRSPRTGLGSNESMGTMITRGDDKYRKYSMDNFLTIPTNGSEVTSKIKVAAKKRKGSHPALNSKHIIYSKPAKSRSSLPRRTSLNVARNSNKNKFSN